MIIVDFRVKNVYNHLAMTVNFVSNRFLLDVFH